MKDFNSHEKLKIEHRKEIEKKQEFKHIGNIKKKKGQFLFAMNPDTFEVYKVELQTKIFFDVSKKKEVGTHKAIINPKHPLMYALNEKNANRKFQFLTK